MLLMAIDKLPPQSKVPEPLSRTVYATPVSPELARPRAADLLHLAQARLATRSALESSEAVDAPALESVRADIAAFESDVASDEILLAQAAEYESNVVSIDRVETHGDSLRPSVTLAIQRALRRRGMMAIQESREQGSKLRVYVEATIDEAATDRDINIPTGGRNHSYSYGDLQIRWETKEWNVEVQLVAELTLPSGQVVTVEGAGSSTGGATESTSSGSYTYRTDTRRRTERAQTHVQQRALDQAADQLAAGLSPYLSGMVQPRPLPSAPVRLETDNKIESTESDAWPKQWGTIPGAASQVDAWLHCGKRAPVYANGVKVAEIEQRRGDRVLMRVNPAVRLKGNYSITIPAVQR